MPHLTVYLSVFYTRWIYITCFYWIVAVIEMTDADHEQNIDVLAEATSNGKLCLYKTGASKIPMMQNNNILPVNNNTG